MTHHILLHGSSWCTNLEKYLKLWSKIFSVWQSWNCYQPSFCHDGASAYQAITAKFWVLMALGRGPLNSLRIKLFHWNEIPCQECLLGRNFIIWPLPHNQKNTLWKKVFKNNDLGLIWTRNWNGNSSHDGEQLCQIILKSIHKCRSYALNKAG